MMSVGALLQSCQDSELNRKLAYFTILVPLRDICLSQSDPKNDDCLRNDLCATVSG